MSLLNLVVAALVAFWKCSKANLEVRKAARPPVRLDLVVFLLDDDLPLERDDRAGLGERHRLLALLRRHEVERSQLIVGAPAAPVREVLHPPFDRVLVDDRARRGLLREGGDEAERDDAGDDQAGGDES